MYHPSLQQLFGLILALFVSLVSVRAQPLYNQTPEFLKGNSIWAFPDEMGLNFSSGTGIPNPTMMPANAQGEGSASVSDRNTGDLLFYTNGAKIWNRNHLPMSNGGDLFGNGTQLSTRQGVLIVPFIDDSTKYYVFSLDNVDHSMRINNPSFPFPPGSFAPQVFVDNNGDTVQGGLFYSVVDMNLNNGLGDVVPGQKNILLDSTALGEAMIAIPGACGTIWLLVHTAGPPLFDEAPQYKAYQINDAGINPVPVLSPGKVHATRSWLAVSSDRSTIALNGGGPCDVIPAVSAGIAGTGLEVARFNIQTGEVSQVVVIEDFDNMTWPPNVPGEATMSPNCAFSPNGNILYYEINNIYDTTYLMQCDISSFDSATIVASKTRIAASPQHPLLPAMPATLLGLRLYKDTLYMIGARHSNGSTNYYISRVNSPNVSGSGCDFEPHAISVPNKPMGGTLGSETVFIPSLSNMIASSEDTLICRGWSQGIQLTPTQSDGTYFTWNDNSTDSVLTIDQGGTYWVNYYTEDCKFHYSDTFHVSGGDLIEPVITVDGFVLSTTLTYSTYQWLLNGNPISGANQQDYTVQENGFYRVAVTNEQGCIDTSDVYEVNNVGIEDVHQLAQQIRVWPNPVREEVFVRSSVPVKLSLSTISGKVIQQRGQSNSLSMRELAAGMYLLRITDKNGNLIKVEKLVKAKE